MNNRILGDFHRFMGGMSLKKHKQLVMVVMISTKWNFCVVCNCSKFLTKIIIVVIITLIKNERIYQKDKKKEISILPQPMGLPQEQQRKHPSDPL